MKNDLDELEDLFDLTGIAETINVSGEQLKKRFQLSNEYDYLFMGDNLTERNKTYIHNTLYRVLEDILTNNHKGDNNAIWILQNLVEIFLSSDYPNGLDNHYSLRRNCKKLSDGRNNRFGKKIGQSDRFFQRYN